MNLSDFRKNKYGDAQKSEQTTFIGAVTGAEGDALKAVHESAQKQVEAQKKASASPAWTERVEKTVTGAGKGSAAGFVNLGGVVVEGLNKVGTYLQSKKDAKQAAQDREYLAKYEQDLKDALAAGDEKAAKTARIRISAAQSRLETNGELTDYYKSVGDSTAKGIYDTADELAESSQTDIARAKQDLGTGWQFAVDVGVAGAQMAGDMGLALLTGGSALAPMAARSFGSSAQEARQEGASFGQQAAYGAMSAAVSVATEKIANVAAPFKKAFGAGVLDKALSGTMQKLEGNAAGKLALSMISEGGEEMLEDLVQPILQRATYDPEALAHYGDADYWTNMLYDGLVGAALGGVGSGMEYAGNRMRGNGQNAALRGADRRKKDAAQETAPAQRITEPPAAVRQEQTQAAPGDVLAELLTGGKRVDQARLTPEQFDAAIAANEQGTVGMDAAGKVYQVDPAQHIDRRTADGVAARGVNAFQFDHPELHRYYQQAAQALIADADLSLQFPMNRSYERTTQGNQVKQSVQASAHLRQAMDETGLSRAEIIDAAQRIVDDHGQENIKAAKQVEIILDDMLTNGWSTMMGDSVGPNQAYIDAKRSIAGSQSRAQGSEALPIWDMSANGALQDGPQGGTMETEIGQEGAYGQGDRGADREKDQRLLRQEGDRQETVGPRIESDTDFLERERAEGRTVRTAGRFRYGYRPVPVESQTAYTKQVLSELRALGVDAFAYDGELRANVNGRTVTDTGEAATLRDGSVGVPNRDGGELSAKEIAAHEACHSAQRMGTPEAQVFFDAVTQHFLLDSDLAKVYLEKIADIYFSGNYDPSSLKHRQKLTGELCAYLSGELYEGTRDVSGMFDDYGAVRAAWEQMIQAARTRGNDGLGAADAGSLNSDYDRLQAQSETFHPEGAYAARPVDVPTVDFDGRNIPKSSSTVMGAQGTDAATVRMLEQQIADGRLSFDTIHDADAVTQAQTAMGEKGFDGALEQYRQAVQANTATKANTALGQQLLLQAMREGNTAATAELLTLYTRNSTTAAQAMQAQSILRKLSPEGQLLAVQKAVSDLNAKYGTDVQLDEGDVADFLRAESDTARREVTQRMVEKAAQSVPGTFRAKYDTLRYLAMLGNPRTHIRNILGNTFFQAPVMVKNRVGAAAEAAASAVTGGKVERTKSIFGANPLGKLAAECRADWTNAKDFLGQSSKYADGQTSLFDIEHEADAFSNGNPLGRGVNRLAEFNSRALEAEDTAAKKWIYTQSLAGYLKANGCKSISDADPSLLNRARNYAAQEALRNTFNDRNAISDFVSKSGNLIRSDNPAAKFAGYIVEGVMPFKRTPTNIAVRAVEYSPVGTVLGAVETARGAQAGDMTRVSAGLDRVAAGVSGTALLAAGFLAAGAGYVTGGEDEDEKQQGFNDLTGHQNYALELDNDIPFLLWKIPTKDKSITLDWLAPEAIPFFMGVELYNQGLENGMNFDDVWSTVKNAAAPMLEMSMLQGLNDTLESVSKAEQRGDNPLGALVVSALTNYLTQIFPTIGGQLERSSEEQRMTTYTDKNGKLPTDLQYTIGKVSQKIPGWDYQQIPYIDAWGRTEESGDALVRAINNLFNPAYVSQVDVDSVEQELQRLKDATGDGGVFPQRAARYFTVNGERKDLTAEEYQEYAKTLGIRCYQLVKEGTGLAAYKAMTDGEKASYIDRLYQYADQTAKANISAYQTESWVRNAGSAKQDIGVSPAEYIALYQQYGSSVMSGTGYEKTKQAVAAGLTVAEYAAMKQGLDADGNDSVSQAEAQAYLDGQSFTTGQKADLWTIINKSWKKNPYQ